MLCSGHVTIACGAGDTDPHLRDTGYSYFVALTCGVLLEPGDTALTAPPMLQTFPIALFQVLHGTREIPKHLSVPASPLKGLIVPYIE